MRHYNQKKEWDKKALKYLENCNKILDIGSGEGRFLSYDTFRITGLDKNPTAYKECQDKYYPIREGEATNLPFQKDSFDGVHCSHIIEHLLPEDAWKMLNEINRVLKVGGLVCFRAPLLHEGFYNNLTHIKPYDPGAILHYLKVEKQYERTMPDIQGFYEVVALEYRRPPLFLKNKWLAPWIRELFNHLQKFKITSWRKNGYLIVLRKVK